MNCLLAVIGGNGTGDDRTKNISEGATRDTGCALPGEYYWLDGAGFHASGGLYCQDELSCWAPRTMMRPTVLEVHDQFGLLV